LESNSGELLTKQAMSQHSFVKVQVEAKKTGKKPGIQHVKRQLIVSLNKSGE
jgi:hypothetical protein